jgi:hypothetical protein
MLHKWVLVWRAKLPLNLCLQVVPAKRISNCVLAMFYSNGTPNSASHYHAEPQKGKDLFLQYVSTVYIPRKVRFLEVC